MGVSASTLDDFKDAMALGAELVTNGGFDAAGTWTYGSGWSYDGEDLAADLASEPSPGRLEQTITIAEGNTYQTQYTIRNLVEGGEGRIRIGGGNGTARTTNGTYIEIIAAGAGDKIDFSPIPNSALTIDNVSVKEITGVTQGFVG